MSLVAAALPSDGLWASVYAGFGIRGADVPATGTHGGSPVRDDLAFPGDADLELTWEIVTPPPTGTLTTYEDLTATYDPPGGTVNLLTGYTYRVRANGVVLYTDTVSIVIGAPTNVLSVTGNIVDATDGMVAGLVVIAPATAGEEIVAVGTMLGQVDGTVQALLSIGSNEEPVPVLDAGVRAMKAGRLTPTRLPHLDAAEVDNLTADMSPVLGTADPIVDVVVTCEDRVGTDAALRPLLYGEWQVQGHLVRQRIKGALGVPGVTYLLRVEATALSGKVAVAVGLVKVLRLA